MWLLLVSAGCLLCIETELCCLLVDIQVDCIKHVDQYIPPLWIMCLESVAHVLVMLNFSSNFLIYCSVSNQFKTALSKLCLIFCKKSSKRKESVKYQNVPTEMCVHKNTNMTFELEDMNNKANGESDEEIPVPSTTDNCNTDGVKDISSP